MRSVNVLDIAKSLTPAQFKQLLELAKAAPQLEKLEAKRQQLLDNLERLDYEIAELAGDLPKGKAPSAAGKSRKKSARAKGKGAATAAKRVEAAAPKAKGKTKAKAKSGKSPSRKSAAKSVSAPNAKAAPQGESNLKLGRTKNRIMLQKIIDIMKAQGTPMNRRQVTELLPASYRTADQFERTMKTISQLFLTRTTIFKNAEKGSYVLV